MEIPQDFKTAILGIIAKGIKSRKDMYLLQILPTAALRTITISWLGPHPQPMNNGC